MTQETGGAKPSFSLPPCPAPVASEAHRLLTLSPPEVSKLGPRECGEAAFVLNQFSFFLQREVGLAKRGARRMEEAVKRRLGASLSRQPGGSREERLSLALEKDADARKLEDARITHALRADELEGLSYRLGEMSKSLMSIKRERDAD